MLFRSHFHYFSQNELHAVRVGPWKLFLPDRKVFYGYVKDRGTSGLELYNLDDDIGEKRDVAAAHPDVVERMAAYYDRWWAEVQPMLVNEKVTGPRLNPFAELYWKQFGGGPTPEQLRTMDPNRDALGEGAPKAKKKKQG